ncbi:hypothetical protein [Rhodanobacter sp. DHB23]|uniref:hypothetical protein n=1 Tax=Rhodanobacter sp. DHB23 TaxID=2775923 RepID=UPI0017863A95|nr:hypothetical protein [Rhodanobacter sp. DHB23]MBD8871978.1 hypothetical protein [Rhodanobacter sp. DHB23]
MELDEMKLAWQTLGQQLERQNALNEQLFRQGRADRLRRHLRPLVWGQSLQIVFGIAVMLWGISFWSTHATAWQNVACGVVMQALGTLALVISARLLAMQQGIDYAAPVLEIQRRLAQMRAWRVRVEAPAFAVLGGVIWIPALLMYVQYEADGLGIKLNWEHVQYHVLAWMALSVGVGVGAVFLARHVVRRLGHGRWLENGLAGSAIVKAEEALAEVASFERE